MLCGRLGRFQGGATCVGAHERRQRISQHVGVGADGFAWVTERLDESDSGSDS